MSVISKMKAQQAKFKSGSDREQTFKPKSGVTRLRILPSWRGIENEDFAKGFGTHFLKDRDGKFAAFYVCDAMTHEEDCKACEALHEAMMNAPDDETKDLIAQARASQRYLLNAINIDDDPKTPVILELSKTTYGKLIDIIIQESREEDEEFNVLTNLEEGHDIKITRSGVGLATKYDVNIVVKSTPVNKSVWEKCANLDNYVNQNQADSLSKTIAVANAYSGIKSKSTALKIAKDVIDAEFEDDMPFYESKKVEEDLNLEEVDANALDDMLGSLV